MSLAIDLFSLVAIGAGAFFFFAGTVGLLRFPDSLTRLHALTKADNLGLGLVVLGLLPRAGSLLDALRLIAIWALVQISGASTAQLIGRALRRRSGQVTVLQILDLGLAILVLAVAAWTVAARELFGAVVTYVAYGLLLSIVWVRLYAPDVALTEAAIGSGVTGVLLVTSGARLGRAGEARAVRAPGLSQRICAAALAVLAAAALAAVILLLPDPAPTLAPEARQGLAATGLGNPVTAVLIAYRSFDTMLEKIVLLLAVVGVWSVAPDRFWGGAPARPRPGEARGRAAVSRSGAGPARDPGRSSYLLGRRGRAGRRLSGRRDSRRNVDDRDDLAAVRAASRRRAVAAPCARRGTGGLSRGRPRWTRNGRCASSPIPRDSPSRSSSFIEAFMVLTIAATLPMLVAGPPRRGPER